MEYRCLLRALLHISPFRLQCSHTARRYSILPCKSVGTSSCTLLRPLLPLASLPNTLALKLIKPCLCFSDVPGGICSMSGGRTIRALHNSGDMLLLPPPAPPWVQEKLWARPATGLPLTPAADGGQESFRRYYHSLLEEEPQPNKSYKNAT